MAIIATKNKKTGGTRKELPKKICPVCKKEKTISKGFYKSASPLYADEGCVPICIDCVKDSVVKGEYLAWYASNIKFINRKIIGTQPLCYCDGLELIDCEMIDSDLAFEKSHVNARILNEMISIKNPLSGEIRVKGVKDIIFDDENATGSIIIE